MKISAREIGTHQPPYLVCEIGANHGGDLGRLFTMIEVAKASGADAVKLQAYEADTITLDHDGPGFTIEDGPWKGQRLYDLYRRAQTPFKWFPRIAEYAEKVGITWFASVFDRTSVDLMARLGAPAIKIASFELVDTPLIRYAARLGKPMILSTGMASREEICSAIETVYFNSVDRETGRQQFQRPALLHCVSGYPTPAGEANLGRLRDLENLSAGPVGLSDHTTGIEIPVAATALGATIIEKHFTLSRRLATPDATFSLEPKEFAAMAAAVRNAWSACRPAEAPSQGSSRPLRRSLYAVADIPAGAPLTETNIRSIRPGHGLPPAELPALIGRIAARPIARGTPLTWELVHATGDTVR